MDELINAFSGTQVSLQENSTAAGHPRFSQFKAKPSSSRQEARRKRFLEALKEKRYDYANHARKLATNEWSDDEEGNEDDVQEMDMEAEILKKPPRKYKDQLMLSEWLVEVPFDLESEWLLKLCPVGKRCMVVASKGLAKVFTKSGYCLNSFRSKVPGANRIESRNKLGTYSIIDCIYNESVRTFFILDVMCWNGHPCYDSETEFRFYWLNSKFEETADMVNDKPFSFSPLPYFDCSQDALKKVLWDPMPFPVKLDGLLFYHKRTHYTNGSTPLVGWLKGYMIPEMLGIDVPETLMSERPSDYTTMQAHCPEAFEVHEKRKTDNEKQMHFEEEKNGE